MRFALITLGCDKNTVDSERYVAELVDRGAEFCEQLDTADVVLVNTCGFIDAAKKESIDALVEAGRLKEEGRLKAVVGLGCMVQRHKAELEQALPEVDLFLGSSEVDRLILELQHRGMLATDERLVPHPGVRVFAGGLPHIRYLKISEGCDHTCAFCAIPLMRGKHRSFAIEDIVREAQLLEAQGAREVNLVAQDLAHYGRDRRDAALTLPDVLSALVRETSIPWIRMLYLYSAGITPSLLELVATESRVAPYFDMPIQHASDAVLERMRRPERQRTIRERVGRIRAAVPDVAIRTTCIVGFPGENDEDFETLLAFLQETQFERVGAFTYSAQEGTRAAELSDDVPDAVKRERLERLNELQRMISSERYESRLGRRTRAIVDRVTDDGRVQGRAIWQADDVDGVTWLGAAHMLQAGDLLDVTPLEVVDDVDLVARVEGRLSAPKDLGPSRRQRALPVMSTAGSYGR